MKIKTLLVAVGLSTVSLNTLGAAFQLAEHSASGLGRAFSGDAAVAENASVVARNPALMSQFKENQLSVVATYIRPDVSLSGENAPEYASASDLDDNSIAPSATVPAAYYIMPLKNNFTLGVGLYSNFGLATEFAQDYAAGQLAGSTEITTVNLNSSLSYQLNEQLTVAAGLNYVYANAKLTRNFGANPLGIPTSLNAISLEGDDSGLGWNLGLAYDFSDSTRFGFAYRSQVDINFEGLYSNQLPAAIGGLAGQSLDSTLAVDLPAGAEFSGSHQLDAQWALHYSVLWTQWNSFEKLEAHIAVSEEPIFSKEENFTNSWRYAIGADYRVNAQIKIRAGIAYDKSPSDPDHQSVSIPDTNRLWLSAGGTYQLNQQSSIDLGLSFLRGEKRSFVEKDTLGATWGFASEGNAAILAAQYNYSF